MGTKYPTQSITGYNASPPPDDGTTGVDNKVTWQKHLDKIGDPIKTQVAAIDTAIVAMADVDTVAKSGNYTTVADDDGRTVECTSTPDITLGAAATMTTGYRVTVKCVSGTTTVKTSDQIDGSASDRTLTAGKSETYVVNAAADKYLLVTEKLNLLDEDDMASDSAVDVASQQSIKKYVDDNSVADQAYTDTEVAAAGFYSYGDGSDGAKTVSADEDAYVASYHYTTYTVDATKTVTAVGGMLVIRATTSITINGTITAEGQGASGGASKTTSSNGNNGSAGSYGGSGGAGGASEGGTSYKGGDGGGTVGTDGGVGATLTAGGDGAAQSAEYQKLYRDVKSIFVDPPPAGAAGSMSVGGGAGGSGGGEAGGTSGAGGAGGGVIILIAPIITIGASGSLNADGADGGGRSGGVAGSGGGGGGGMIFVATPSYTDNSTGGVHATAGTGNATGTYPAGDGADGYLTQVTL